MCCVQRVHLASGQEAVLCIDIFHLFQSNCVRSLSVNKLLIKTDLGGRVLGGGGNND